MSKVDQLLNALHEMQVALTANDVDRVQQLMDEHLTIVQELKVEAKADPSMRTSLKERIGDINERIQTNEKLIQQGLAISDSVVRQLLSRKQQWGKPLTSHTYWA